MAEPVPTTMVVKATKPGVQYSPDGVNINVLPQGEPVAIPTDVALGLIAQELVEEAEGAEPVAPQPAAKTTATVDVASVASLTSDQLANLGPEERAKLDELRRQELPPAKPNVEPIEHGGDSLDRILTRGVDGDAVEAEDADIAASTGKASAAAELALQLEDPATQAQADQLREQEEKADQTPEQKMEQSAENKSAPTPRRRKS